jgi:hypothetical protein
MKSFDAYGQWMSRWHSTVSLSGQGLSTSKLDVDTFPGRWSTSKPCRIFIQQETLKRVLSC